MVPFRPAPLVWVLMLMALGFSGCLGADDVADPDEVTDDTDQTDGGGAAIDPDLNVEPDADEDKTLKEVDPNQAVFAPTWATGDYWTFDVVGKEHLGGSVTLQVVEVAADHYVLGTDNVNELTYNTLNGGPFLPSESGVQFDSLAVFQDEEYQDYLGFRREVGAVWEFRLLDMVFDLEKLGVEPVSYPGGESMGLRLNGTANNDRVLEVEYAQDVRWFTRFAVLEADGTPYLTYELTAFGSGGVGDVKRWTQTGREYHVAQTPVYPLGQSDETLFNAGPDLFESDGTGDLMVVVYHLEVNRDDGRSRAEAFTPAGESVGVEELEGLGERWITLPLADAEGRWSLWATALAGGTAGRVYTEMWLLQVTETTF